MEKKRQSVSTDINGMRRLLQGELVLLKSGQHTQRWLREPRRTPIPRSVWLFAAWSALVRTVSVCLGKQSFVHPTRNHNAAESPGLAASLYMLLSRCSLIRCL